MESNKDVSLNTDVLYGTVWPPTSRPAPSSRPEAVKEKGSSKLLATRVVLSRDALKGIRGGGEGGRKADRAETVWPEP